MITKTFLIDFGKTIAETNDGKILKIQEEAVSVIKQLLIAGHVVKINTLRADLEDRTRIEKAYLAVRAADIHIPFLNSKVVPEKFSLTSEVVFIDDKLDGMPLKKGELIEEFVVDFKEIERMLTSVGLIEPKQRTWNELHREFLDFKGREGIGWNDFYEFVSDNYPRVIITNK